MVEGHGCHRVAHAHRKLLVGKHFVAKSPNGRFTEGGSVPYHFDFLNRAQKAIRHVHKPAEGLVRRSKLAYRTHPPH